MSDPSAVPRPVRQASEWAWRLLLIAAAGWVLVKVIGTLSEVVIPLVVAALLAALLRPAMARLERHLPRGAAAGITVLGTIVVISALLTLIGSQFSSGFGDLTDQVAEGLQQVRDWLTNTFHLSDAQFTQYFDTIKKQIQSGGNVADTAAAFGLTATHAIAGLFIALFTLFFFLYDGARIWAWVVRLFPRSARGRVDSSGHIAWGQLSAFTRATIMVAAVDAIGIMIGALVLRVPFALAIGVLVFLGAFVPIIGAALSGSVAVLLALVDRGPIVALLMLLVVIAVQQLESHVLQPFLLGRAVRIHPLAVILAIATGVIVAGIVGALVAVPLVAVANAVGHHLAEGDEAPAPDEAALPVDD